MYKSITKKGAGLDGAVVESIRIEGDSIIVSARPRKRAPRCPVCGGALRRLRQAPGPQVAGARRRGPQALRGVPDGAGYAQVLAAQAVAAGAGGVTPIHRNSRNLLKKKFNSDAKMRIVRA